MQLDELKWYQHKDAQPGCLCADVGDWHLCSRIGKSGPYSISRCTTDGVLRNRFEYSELDPIEAQAVLYHLLAE